MIRQIYTAKVQSIVKVNHYIWEIWIKLDMPFMFKAGQFISMFVSDKEARAYSMASSPRYCVDEGRIRLIIGPHPGSVSDVYINSLKVNDTVTFRGPFGIFTIDRTVPDITTFDKNIDLAFVATSTGIAPFLSMIEYLEDVGAQNKVTLYFGLRNHRDILLEEEFKRLQTKLNFEYYYCISQPEEGTSESNVIHHGYVTDLLFQKQENKDYYYLCGSTKVISSIATSLREKNNMNIFFENYG